MQYYIRSTALGGAVLTEVNYTGKKLKTFVQAAGTVVAWQVLTHLTNGNVVEQIRFEHTDASGTSRRMTDSSGGVVTGEEEDAPAEFDTTGNSIGLENPYVTWGGSGGEGCIGCGGSGIVGIDDNSPLMVNGSRVTTAVDGVATSQQSFLSFLGVMLGGSGKFGLLDYAASQLRIQTEWRYNYTTSRGKARSDVVKLVWSNFSGQKPLAKSPSITLRLSYRR